MLVAVDKLVVGMEVDQPEFVAGYNSVRLLNSPHFHKFRIEAVELVRLLVG